MHHDVGVHLGDLHGGDRRCLAIGPSRASGASVYTDVVQLAVLFDHLDAGLVDVSDGYLDDAAEVFGPLEAHNACRADVR